MNQILQTDLKNKHTDIYNQQLYEDTINYYNSEFKKNTKLKLLFKLQLYSSIMLIIVISTFIIRNNIILTKKEKYSSEVLENYNITKLYANLSSNNKINNSNNESLTYIDKLPILGIIEIPSINVYYPVFSNYDDELLKIAPCKFYGTNPGKKGNLCIAGHNYDNDKFFSKISYLNIDDEIIVFDSLNKKFSYYVFTIYEVLADDLSPIYDFDENSKELTLITCNNLNKNRIIVKAKIK